MQKTRKQLIWIILIISALGGILFFPVNLNNEFTCLFHHIIESGGDKHTELVSVMGHGSEELLNQYLVPYGLFWWFSLGILALALIQLFRNRKLTEKL